MAQTKVFRKRILLADDERGVREAIKYLLRIDEHVVTEADNGAQALELFAKGPFDLVITDYLMPQMRGDELATSIKRLSPSQPILMISAYAEQFAGGKNPIDALLRKPFTFQELRASLARLLTSANVTPSPGAHAD